MPARHQKGFTLIELMVVIAIIAILATVGFTTYTSAQRGGRDTKRIADMQEIQKALEQYYALNGKYVDTLASASLSSYFEGQRAPSETDPGWSAYSYVRNDPVSGCLKDKYIACAKLESCGGGKCTAAVEVTDPCASPSDPTPPTTPTGYYCIGSLSN